MHGSGINSSFKLTSPLKSWLQAQIFAWLLANAGSKDVTPDDSLYRNTVFSLLFEGELVHPDKIRRRMEIAINRIYKSNKETVDFCLLSHAAILYFCTT